MINSNSVQAVGRGTWRDRWLRPLYESYCFANIPGAVEQVLTGGHEDGILPADTLEALGARHQRVVVLFVDAMGWRFFTRYMDELNLLQRAVKEGVVSMITAQFPSTTSAHVTTIHTGLPMGVHGVYEWFYFEPMLDQVIAPLLFARAHEHNKRETLVADPAAVPGRLFPSHESYPRKLFYPRLREAGVAACVHQPSDYADSTYSKAVCAAAQLVPYGNLRHACENVVKLLQRGGPQYHFMYVDPVDSALHKNGPTSDVVDNVVHDVFSTIEEHLVGAIGGGAGETLLLFIADHGQVEVDPKRTYYLNWRWPVLESKLRRNRAGELIRFGGSARDLFLYVQEAEIPAVVSELSSRLMGRAEVYPTLDLLDQGIFGQVPPGSPLLARLGDVVILPYRGHSIYWREEKFDMHFRGHHGGLTREEMEVPLVAMVV